MRHIAGWVLCGLTLSVPLPALATEKGQVLPPDGLSVTFVGQQVLLDVTDPSKSFVVASVRADKEGGTEVTKVYYLSSKTGTLTVSSADYQRLGVFELAGSIALGFSEVSGWRFDGRPCVCILPPPPPPVFGDGASGSP